MNFVSLVDVWVISGLCCCSEMLMDAVVKSDYLMQEMEKKNGSNKFILTIFKTHNSDTN